MEWIANPVNVILHLNLYLSQVADAYGPWVYGLLFLIIFSQLMLLSEGEVVYFGPTKDVVPHFASLGFQVY